MKKLGLILLIAVLASVLPGCAGVAITNVNGRGTVEMNIVEIGTDDGLTGTASFSLSFACYAQNNNRMQGYVNWNDPTNGVRISATLPETSVKSLGIPNITTCKALKAAAATLPFSVNAAGVYSEDGNANGDMGTQTGIVFIIVAKPGVPIPAEGPIIAPIDCGSTGTAVAIFADTQNYSYVAGGCLDRGKIVFGSGGQNQQ